MNRVLALTKDGKITYCTAPEEMRGKGRCNHIAHQTSEQSVEDFISSIENSVKTENNEIPDNRKIARDLISKYGRIENPNWKEMIESIQNPFVIGKDDDGSYEESELVDFNQELINKDSGNVYHLTAKYKFRGREFECDYGEVPVVNEDGTITLDGVEWRVLPVLEQNKSGVISYNNNIVIRQQDGKNISLLMSKDPNVDTLSIYGAPVPIDVVQNYLQNGETKGLTSGQIWALKLIDPIAYQRFPNLATDLRSLKELKPDEVGDLSWRKCITYEDTVKEQYRLQLRRMGVTFRVNLEKRQKNSDDPMSEELDDKFPLFYQVNLTDNVKKDLVGRSNVQYADNLNPISALSQAQKISFTGPGGFHKDKVPYELRMPHKTHEHTIDAMDISSGKNVGLTATLSMGGIGKDRFIYEKGENADVLSPSDFIPYKLHNDPNRGIMGVAHMKQGCPIVGGEEPIVKTRAWEKIPGAKLGVNAKIAYVPDPDCFEDAVKISESLAASMTTIQSHKFQAKAPLKGVQVGQRVERKQVIGGQEMKYGGIVKSVNESGDSFEIESTFEMGVGDKLAGRHGNKSVVSKVVPDKDMPKILNERTGRLEPAQIIMSPLSVAGRKNLGQVMETNEANGYGPVVDKKQKVILSNGHQVEATAGVQYILRLNHIAEKKLSSHADELTAKREAEGARLGEMESILLSTDEDRLKVLNYLRHQEAYDSHKKLGSLLKAVGVNMTGVNWKDS